MPDIILSLQGKAFGMACNVLVLRFLEICDHICPTHECAAFCLLGLIQVQPQYLMLKVIICQSYRLYFVLHVAVLFLLPFFEPFAATMQLADRS